MDLNVISYDAPVSVQNVGNFGESRVKGDNKRDSSVRGIVGDCVEKTVPVLIAGIQDLIIDYFLFITPVGEMFS